MEGGKINIMKAMWESVEVIQVKVDGGSSQIVLARMKRHAWETY